MALISILALTFMALCTSKQLEDLPLTLYQVFLFFFGLFRVQSFVLLLKLPVTSCSFFFKSIVVYFRYIVRFAAASANYQRYSVTNLSKNRYIFGLNLSLRQNVARMLVLVCQKRIHSQRIEIEGFVFYLHFSILWVYSTWPN